MGGREPCTARRPLAGCQILAGWKMNHMDESAFTVLGSTYLRHCLSARAEGVARKRGYCSRAPEDRAGLRVWVRHEGKAVLGEGVSVGKGMAVCRQAPVGVTQRGRKALRPSSVTCSSAYSKVLLSMQNEQTS